MSDRLAGWLKKTYGGSGWEQFAEEARVKLSSSTSLTYLIPVSGPCSLPLSSFTACDDSGSDSDSAPPPDTKLVTVTRKDFEKSIEPLIPRLTKPVREVAALADVALLGDARPGKFADEGPAPLESPMQPEGTEGEADLSLSISDLKKQQKGKVRTGGRRIEATGRGPSTC